MNNTIYNNIINDISKSLKYQLNEMARKSVNRTIDKKLWLTVSSIISRNRSTEAEDIKPIGNDKDNLLQRYVASLLIMKKPCPTSIEDIGKLKTFKKIGYKFIDLGGTIQDIQKLYNENSGNTNNSDNHSNSDTTTKSDNTTSNTDDNSDDDFFKNFGSTNTDTDDNDGFFGDLIDNDYNASISSKIDKQLNPVTNKTDIKQIFANITGEHNIPSQFKLVKPKNQNEWQKLVYIDQNSKRLDIFDFTTNTIGKFKSFLKSKNWKYYQNPILNKLLYSSKLLPVDIAKEQNIDNIIKTLQEYKYLAPAYYQQDYIDNLPKMSNTFKELITLYNDFVNNIDNDIVKNIFADSAYTAYVLLSPDNGLIYIHTIQVTYDNSCSSRRNSHSQYYIGVYANYTAKSILEFTGKTNYYDITNSDEDAQSYKDKQKAYAIKKKQFAVFNNIATTYFKELNKYYWANISDYSVANFKKFSNGSYGIEAYAKDRFNNNFNIADSFWYGNDKQKRLRTRQRNKFGEYSIFTCLHDNITNAVVESNVVSFIRNINNTMIYKQYKQVNGKPPMLRLELLPAGLDMFIEECEKKNIPLD